MHRLITGTASVMLFLFLTGCPDKAPGDTGGSDFVAETLDDEPDGSPVDVVDGRLECLDAYTIRPPSGGALELTGYIRALADPEAEAGEPPEAAIEVFSSGGSSIGSAFSDPSRGGRSAVSIPIADDGFQGWVQISAEGFLDERFSASIPITDTSLSAWAFLATAEDVDTAAVALGATDDASGGTLIGAVHDCDGFGAGNVLITVDGGASGIYYVEGFEPIAGRTYTSITGRFAMGGLPAGEVEVKAWARLEDGGPLTLLSSLSTTMQPGTITAVALEPRPSAK